jgi:multicomponent Na+:H+ antiporter subunit G
MSELFSAALLLIGALFMFLAALGLLRLPDLFMRLQAATKASTLGVGCMLLGLAIHFQDLAVTTRAVLIVAFFFLTAPVGAHMIARAAYAVGVPLWEGTITDELRDHRRAPGQAAPSSPDGTSTRTPGDDSEPPDGRTT